MSTLTDLLAARTDISHAHSEHLQLLVGEWQLLADLSFADLLLWVPTSTGDLLCVAQVRPTTSPTVYFDDLVGHPAEDAPLRALSKTLESVTVLQSVPNATVGEVQRTSFPVRPPSEGPDLAPPIAVLTRDTKPSSGLAPSPLETAYLGSGNELALMLTAGTFPVASHSPEVLTGPRAGDGLIRLDSSGTVLFVSPNALSAYRRMGVNADLQGQLLTSLTKDLVTDPFDGEELVKRVEDSLAGGSPLRIEVDVRGAIVLFRALPLRAPDYPPGALVLLRDVTDVRRRDRQLLSKDATIREIHHRVKNNLQTVAALLRLQARRVSSPDAKLALQESVRRVASIALVHETLSLSLDERVDFDGIVDRLVPMVLDVATPDAHVAISREGTFGVLSADVATPMVMVLAELLQNAVEHAFKGPGVGQVVVRSERSTTQLTVQVRDDGAGLPPGFSLEASERLGLQIVRTLVESELQGTISVRSERAEGGTEARLVIPVSRRLRNATTATHRHVT